MPSFRVKGSSLSPGRLDVVYLGGVQNALKLTEKRLHQPWVCNTDASYSPSRRMPWSAFQADLRFPLAVVRPRLYSR